MPSVHLGSIRRGRVGWGWVAGALSSLGLGVTLAVEMFAPVGSTLGTFDTYTHSRDASLRTFPHPDGHLPGLGMPLGMAVMPDGRVAVLLDDTVTPQHPNVVHFLRVTPVPTAFEVAGEAIVPRYASNEEVLFTGGPVIDADGQFVFLAQWFERTTNATRKHYYLMRTPFRGGEATPVAVLPSDLPRMALQGADHYSAMVGVRRQGAEPEGYLLSLHGSVGARPFFLYVDTAGRVVREIVLDEFLPTAANPCFYGRFAMAASGDDFLVFACAEGPRNVCIRFDRYGAFKGAWNFGAALPGDPWLPPDPFETFVQLPSGDLLTASLFARYILGTTDRSGTTWRYYVLRPPRAFGMPVCVVSPETLDFGSKAHGTGPSSEVTIRNAGSAELIVSSVSIQGAGAEAFRRDGPEDGRLPPSFGLPGAEGSLVETIRFAPASPGLNRAALVVESNDPVNPVQRVPLVGFAEPPGYADTVVFDTAALSPWPHEAKAFTLAADGSRASVLFEMVEPSQRSGRIYEVPIRRSPDGRVADLNAAAAVPRIDTMERSVYGLATDADGTAWYGPAFSSQKTLFQRKPDGTVLSFDLPVGNGPPYDLDFTPDGTRLLVARGASRLFRYVLTRRTDGFHDLTYDGRLLLEHAAGIYTFAVWPNPADNFLVYEASGELRLVLGLDRFWYRDGPPADPSPGIALSWGLSVKDLGMDSVSGDLLYLDTNRRLHRLDGFRALVPPVPAASVLRLTGVGFNWSTRRLTLGWTPWAEAVVVESSLDLRHWVPEAGPLTGTSAFLPIPVDGAPRFWRVKGRLENRTR